MSDGKAEGNSNRVTVVENNLLATAKVHCMCAQNYTLIDVHTRRLLETSIMCKTDFRISLLLEKRMSAVRQL